MSIVNRGDGYEHEAGYGKLRRLGDDRWHLGRELRHVHARLLEALAIKDIRYNIVIGGRRSGTPRLAMGPLG